MWYGAFIIFLFCTIVVGKTKYLIKNTELTVFFLKNLYIYNEVKHNGFYNVLNTPTNFNDIDFYKYIVDNSIQQFSYKCFICRIFRYTIIYIHIIICIFNKYMYVCMYMYCFLLLYAFFLRNYIYIYCIPSYVILLLFICNLIIAVKISSYI